MAAARSISLLAKLTAPLKEFELNKGEIMKYEMIGSGSASTVYSGTYRGEQIAIKEMLFDDDLDGYDEATINAFYRELDVWLKVEHPHVLKFRGLCNGEPFVLCSELCLGGTLFDLLHNCWDIPIGWDQRLLILKDIAGAVDYLHSLNTPVIHRDLKSLNVLLMDAFTGPESIPNVKLSDFGFARFSGKSKDLTMTLTRGAGTMHWMAPEVSGGTRYHSKVDVFSYAVIMYEVVCRRMAFEDMDPEQACHMISRGERADLGPEFAPPDTPAGLIPLIQTCWQEAPRARPDFSEIITTLSGIV